MVELNPLVGCASVKGDNDGQAVFNGIIASMERNKETTTGGIKVSDSVVETSYDDRAGKTWGRVLGREREAKTF